MFRRDEEDENRTVWFDKIDKGVKEIIESSREELTDSVRKWWGEYIDEMEKRQTYILQRLENLENFKKYVETHK